MVYCASRGKLAPAVTCRQKRGTYLRSEETGVTDVSSAVTGTPSIALHHIIINLSRQTQKYLPVMNRQINVFLSLG